MSDDIYSTVIGEYSISLMNYVRNTQLSGRVRRSNMYKL